MMFLLVTVSINLSYICILGLCRMCVERGICLYLSEGSHPHGQDQELQDASQDCNEGIA